MSTLIRVSCSSGATGYMYHQKRNMYTLEHTWGGAHRARGEAECSMKLHPNTLHLNTSRLILATIKLEKV